MKTIKLKVFTYILVVSVLVLISCVTSESNPNKTTSDNIIVILKFKAQPNQGVKTVSELTNLLEKVKLEPHFKEVNLHVDPKDNTNILLYEEWEDENYYNSAHMETAHINEFMANSSNFLTGPPEITFWKVVKKFR